eukprot:12920944-Prorocentrum_lima.AAC.1
MVIRWGLVGAGGLLVLVRASLVCFWGLMERSVQLSSHPCGSLAFTWCLLLQRRAPIHMRNSRAKGRCIADLGSGCR